jgi:drug/metabolite transporter (DMT)-like permease
MSASDQALTSRAGRHEGLGLLYALAAASIWGLAFTVLKFAYEGLGPWWLSSSRFFAAFALGLPFALIHRETRLGLSWKEARLSLPAGFFLGGCLVFQAVGLTETSVANSGFITVLYAIMVPLGEALLLRRAVSPRVWGCVLLAMAGSFLFSEARLDTWNRGDGLTFLCAVMAAGHILTLTAVEPRIQSAYTVNLWQMLWAGIFTLPLALIMEPLPDPRAFSPTVILSFGYIVLLSTLGGFWLQVKTQQHLPATRAGLIYLLESPLAALGAFLLLGEGLSAMRLLGASIILLAAALAVARTSQHAPHEGSAKEKIPADQ